MRRVRREWRSGWRRSFDVLARAVRGKTTWTRLKCHNPVAGVRTPWRRSSLLRWTVTDLASNVTMQPTSQSWPIDRSDVVCNAGTMYTRRASKGKLGKSNSASCVEYMMDPLGLAMPIGRDVGRLFMTAAETVQK